MIWLLKLYPRQWRRRYGAEVADLVAASPFSIGGALDLIGGAVDAWLHPELIRPTSDSDGGTSMIKELMRFDCTRYGASATQDDKVKNWTVNIGGTLILAIVWLWMVWFAKHHAFSAEAQAYLLAAGPMAYVLPYLIGLRYTSLKGRSAAGQAISILSVGATVMAILLAAGWISMRI
jgi:hypothetical protein